MKGRHRHVLFVLLIATFCALPFQRHLRRAVVSVVQSLKGRHTVAERLGTIGAVVRGRLRPDFERLGLAYPPAAATFVGLKQERRLQVWVADGDGALRLLRSYAILGASGALGPKLREGDHQVPEGVYAIESLNPNSMFHLSLRLDYPNAFDRDHGRRDGRDKLGSDIMIHGSTASAGCLAMGDDAAEELFVLAADTGIDRVRVILSPVDFRIRDLPPDPPACPPWTPQLYALIRAELRTLVE